MEIYILLISGIIIFFVYILFSSKYKEYINGLSLITFKLLFLYILMPFLYFIYYGYYTGYLNNIYILDKQYIIIISFIYLTYYIFLVLGYLKGKNKKIIVIFVIKEKLNKKKLIIISLFFLFISIYLWLQYTSKFGIMNVLKNPRRYYTISRIGFGHLTFILAMCIRIFFILSLFIYRNKFIPLLISSFFLYILGSKSTLLLLLVIFIFYKITIDNKNIKNPIKLTLFGIFSFVILLSTFYIYSTHLRNISMILKAFSRYADYTRNFIVLLQSDIKHFYGEIFFENSFYTLIPRILVPFKPKIFGSIKVAYMIFPETTVRFTGAPSFGFLGPIYADFGYLGLFFSFLDAFFKGFFIGMLENTLKTNKSPFLFMFYLLMVGVPILSVGVGGGFVFIAINLLIIYFLYIFYRINFGSKRIII